MVLESVHDEVRRLALSDLLSDIQNEGKADSDNQNSSGGGLNGQSFVFTGTLTTMKRADAQKQGSALGGVAASSVSASLSYLVIGDAGKAGSKLDKAKSLGVPVISESEFMTPSKMPSNLHLHLIQRVQMQKAKNELYNM